MNIHGSAKDISGAELGAKSPVLFVVDDDALSRQIFAAHARIAGFQVREYDSVLGAKKAWRAHVQCDVLVTDLMMLDGNGLSLANYVRAKTPRLPIVFYTGYSLNEHVDFIDKCRQIGSVWTKPMHREELNSRLIGLLAAIRDA